MEEKLVWRVGQTEEGKLIIEFGDKLTESPGSDSLKLAVLGESLIVLGSRLMHGEEIE